MRLFSCLNLQQQMKFDYSTQKSFLTLGIENEGVYNLSFDFKATATSQSLFVQHHALR